MPCVDVVVPQILDCNSLAVDTWKPATTNPKTGEYLDVTVRSNSPNQDFDISYMGLLTREFLLNGKTDENGCFTGQIPPQADGTYKLEVCFHVPLLGCLDPKNPISVTWGTKPMDLATMGLIAAGLLGIAYILGNKK